MNDAGDGKSSIKTNSGASAKALLKPDDETPAPDTSMKAKGSQEVEELRAVVAERERADHLRRDSEAHLQLALDAAGMATWDWDIVNGVFRCSDQLGPMMGLPAGYIHPSCEAFYENIYEEDRERFRAATKRALEERADFSLEFRFVWPDGSIHWHASKGHILPDQPGRMIGVAMDITERKQAECSRYHLLSRIVAAQEEERRRVSRELHDQMGQNLAAMIVGLESLKANIAEVPQALDRVRELQELASRLSQEVHSLAWDLRPPALDDLGLHTALQRYVEHWSERSGVIVDWHTNGFTSRRLPSQVETTLYRIVQEALTNVLRHAKASRVSLILRASGNHVFAIIEDNGQGFDAEFALRSLDPHDKLGLIGMQERVLLVNGTLNIESVLGHGTTVYVRIPLGHS